KTDRAKRACHARVRTVWNTPDRVERRKQFLTFRREQRRRHPGRLDGANRTVRRQFKRPWNGDMRGDFSIVVADERDADGCVHSSPALGAALLLLPRGGTPAARASSRWMRATRSIWPLAGNRS